MSDVSQPTRSVGILAFDAMEVLDYAGPYEVFNVAGEITIPAAFDVAAIGVHPGPITGRGGFTVLPPATVIECEPPDILIVPGGPGSRPIARDMQVVEWIRNAADGTEVVVSVCTGALILAAASLLDGRRATTHHDAFDELRTMSPSTEIIRDSRFVESAGGLWTSGGISAGIDISLHLVGLLAGAETRDRVIAEMEWGW